MKRFIFTLTFFFAFTLFAQDKKVDSHIVSVVVYPDCALVSRAAAIKLERGINRAVFSDIKPLVDENTLRVFSPEDKGIKFYGATLVREQLKDVAADNLRALQEEITALQDVVKEYQDSQAALRDEKKFLNSIQLFSSNQLPKDLVTRMPTAAELGETFNFLGARLKENYKAITALDIKLRQAHKEMELSKRKLRELSGASSKVKRSIVLEVEAAKSMTREVVVSYVVRGASWRPLYDARADIDKGGVELTSYALVRQATGEDWSNVNLSVSTAKPSFGGRLPYVAPWLLRPQEARYKRLAGNRALKVQTEALDQMHAYEEPAEEGNRESVPQVIDSGIAVTYELPQKVSLKSDNSENKFAISSQELKADFTYSAYPRASNLAYLGSRVKNAPNLQLLSGSMNVFLNGDFVGKSGIDNIGPGEEFDLYLGSDENVKVERKLIERKIDQTLIGSVLSPNKVTSLRYRLKVENYKPRAIKVRLFEATPASEDDRIKIKSVKASLNPDKKNWHDRRGVWLWSFDLPPSVKKEITLDIVIEHPRKMQVEGL